MVSLASWIPGANATKIPTAIGFIACSIGFYASLLEPRGLFAIKVLTIAGPCFSAMLAHLAFFEVLSLGPNAVLYPNSAHLPSLGTVLAFDTVAMGMYWRAYATGENRRCIFSRICGIGLLVFAACVLVGYAIDMPAMMWAFPGLSVPVAYPTAFGFGCYGVGLLALPGTNSSNCYRESQ